MTLVRPSDQVIVDEVRETYGAVAVQPGDTVLDLGAHIGAASLLFLERGAARVVAVEPDPANVEQLRANVAGRPVEIIEAAVGPKAGATDLYAHPARGYLSTTLASDVGRVGVRVRVVAFGDLLAEHRPAIVKCDIEFGEYALDQLWDLPPFVRVLALELHLRFDLIYDERRETPAELLARRRHAAGLRMSLQRQGFTVDRLTTKLGSVPGIDDSTGFDPLARSVDGVWVR